MLATKKLVKNVVSCEKCGCSNEISAENLTTLGETWNGRHRYVRYTCKHCGKVNTMFSREVSVHILRQMHEV